MFIKMSEKTYYQRNIETILNRAKKYENDKKGLREQPKNKSKK